jgi:hypothetical protein
MLLIEWKYTEAYSAPKKDDPRNKERRRRYESLAFAPEGPLRPDPGVRLEDLFAEPIYQLFWQQMLATRLQRDTTNGLKRVRTMLVSPRGNTPLQEVKIEALTGFGPDLITVWRAMLRDPDSFVYCEMESLFGYAQTAIAECSDLKAWGSYMSERYGL